MSCLRFVFHSSFSDCGDPGMPDNGNVTAEHTKFGAVATYHCRTGRSLRGYTKSSCLATGKWSGSTPKCVKGKCKTLYPTFTLHINKIGTFYCLICVVYKLDEFRLHRVEVILLA